MFVLNSSWLGGLTVCLVAILVYWDEDALHGPFAYDDAGTVTRNPAVANFPGQPWSEIWQVDFWGTKIWLADSHKSYRPLTSLTFKANVWLAKGDMEATFWFHVVNVVLHGIVSALLTFVAYYVFYASRDEDGNAKIDQSNMVAAIVGGITFALHPVHTEAVCNVTGRAELMMSFFYLLGLLSYVGTLHHSKRGMRLSFAGTILLCFLPFVFTIGALLSKEQGFTLCLSCVMMDYCYSDVTIPSILLLLWRRPSSNGDDDDDDVRLKLHRQEVWWFLARTMTLGFGTLMIGLARLKINGDTQPNIIAEQNPAAFAEDFTTRVFSVNYVYWLYMSSFLFPKDLSCDWSGNSISLITSTNDPRVVLVFGLWLWFFGCLINALLVKPGQRHSRSQKCLLNCIMSLMFLPFLLASNLVVKTGTMKAERVAYLPSAGFCLLIGFVVEQISLRSKPRNRVFDVSIPMYCTLFCLYSGYLYKVNERNYAWSNSLHLWEAAYQVNPISTHSRYNYGLELTKAGRFQESIAILKTVVDEKPYDFPTRYIYAMNFRQLQRCPRVLQIADEGLTLLDRKQKNAKVGDLRVDLSHDRSLMYTLKSYCSETIAEMSHFADEAVRIAPQNEQAIGRAKELIELYHILTKKT